ncbi:MAG: beta-ketoacyl-ACP synthase III [Rickettsiaceae bacterium]
MRSRILGCGAYLPEKVVKNDYFESVLDTTDEWIYTRTGIKQRHFANDDQHTSHLAYQAGLSAIRNAAISKDEIDLIIVATTTADNSFPSVATKVQNSLNLDLVPAFDLQGVCSGFIYGLQVADALITSGKHKTILFIGAEKMSSLLDFTDRTTCVLFGDGAGAVILRGESNCKSGIIDTKIYSKGSHCDLLYTDGGIGVNQIAGKIKMQGPILFKYAVENMSDSIQEILAINHLTHNDVDHFIPHQANIRIIDSVAKRLSCNMDKIVTTVEMQANCAAASIPLALFNLYNDGKLNKGDLLLFTAFGAGLTWGSALVIW